MIKSITFKTKGMQRDLSASAFNPEFAFENKNIRILSNSENSLSSITNEKGNKVLNFEGVSSIIGIPVGQAVVDNDLILFSTFNKDVNDINYIEDGKEYYIIADELDLDVDLEEEDKIYKFNIKEDKAVGEVLYSGNLNLDTQHPIEAVSVYENSELKKLYWTDGFNQPRVINIAAAKHIRDKWKDTSFDFIQSLVLKETISIERLAGTNGRFPSGTIQYAFTYFNLYGQESNIFYTSPLYYIGHPDKGGSPEDSITGSFSININNANDTFDGINIYSIQRTSIDSTPTTKKVASLSIAQSINFIDNGNTGSTIDPTELLYLGGEEIVAGTLSYKDNTLFLGNLELKRKSLTSIGITHKNWADKILFDYKEMESPIPEGIYPYKNSLDLNSQKIKTFKYLEHYRFGIQAQHYTGKWSDPIWIGDKQNDKPINNIFYEGDSIKLPIAKCTIDDKELLGKLLNEGYIKIRPVIVFPTLQDREVICQGVLCPTVYNVKDRDSNSPFVQSSWFARPNAPYNIEKTGDIPYSFRPLNNESDTSKNTIYSREGIVSLDTVEDMVYPNKGAWTEFRHNYPLPSNNKRNAEIQCISYEEGNTPYPYIRSTNDRGSWVQDNSENYYVDQSILTLHSPDIEFDESVQTMDISNLKLRIVGMVPLTSSISDIDIQTSTPPLALTTSVAPGFYKKTFTINNNFSTSNSYLGDSHFGWRGLVSGIFWLDGIEGVDPSYRNYIRGYMVYPWHRNGSLNNTKNATNGYKAAMLDKKKISNLRYSYKSKYLPQSIIWEPPTGISGAAIFNSNEVSAIKIPAPKNSNLENDILYYGNIDKLLTTEKEYPIIRSETAEENKEDENINYDKLFNSNLIQVTGGPNTSKDPVRIKYKSTPHALVALNYLDNTQVTLPTLYDAYEDKYAPLNSTTSDIPQIPFWGKAAIKISNPALIGIGDALVDYLQGPIKVSQKLSPQHGWLWLGELYNDSIKNRFGGDSAEAIENNQWLPCGDAVSINSISVDLEWSEGDTYYQRYDHIKTYPFTLEDQNSITEIISFMCETRVNLDGRYDSNRGQQNNLVMTPANFNKINKVYSQSNNFFTYRSNDPNKLNLNKFNNTITWSKSKTLGEITDSWTNITLASTLDLDGDKGKLNSLRRFNNDIIAFQDKGISHILYNENVQISTTSGVPIEIANSGKVQGKRYITNNIGCVNKWSICETPNGLYFIDSINKSIFLFNGQVHNISDKLGFNSWVHKEVDNLNIWNPKSFDSFVTYYDNNYGDILFINKDYCLAFSEPLGQFTSFYSYENTPFITNVEGNTLAINHTSKSSDYKLWLQNKGEYNMFFDKYQPFYTTIIANTNPNINKIFNNIEFRADSWNSDGELLNTTFDTLDVWNEYQNGTSKLSSIQGHPSTLKRKFRIWRANIPRDSSNYRDRMRNPWLYLKLSTNDENTNKTVLHDITVDYI